MSDKLTREECDRHRQSWEAIELHTSECVAEAVAEAVKDRYRIGESVDVHFDGQWQMGIITGSVHRPSIGCYEVASLPVSVRRPPVLREMTDEELLSAIVSQRGLGFINRNPYSRPTLEAMAHDLGIETRVEV